jgi:hypothetical protein
MRPARLLQVQGVAAVNRLFYNRVYLAGPIDHAKDFGVGWRRYVQDQLAHLNLIFLDPTHKPMQAGYACEDLEVHAERARQREAGDFDALAAGMRLIRHIDLRMCDLCDFSIAHLDLTVYSAGSHEEIAQMNRRKVPVLIHVQQGKHRLPDWYWGAVPHQHVFGDWENLFAYLDYVARSRGPIDIFGRWRFLDYGMLHGLTAIPLTQGKVAAISPEDHHHLSKWRWCAVRQNNYWRAMRKTSGGTTRYMHQDIATYLGWNNSQRLVCDHVNGNPLDNTRDNLRLIPQCQNCHNRGAQRNSQTGIKGVWYDKRVGKFGAEIKIKGVKHWLGHFPTVIDAQVARNVAGRRLVGACCKPS